MTPQEKTRVAKFEQALHTFLVAEDPPMLDLLHVLLDLVAVTVVHGQMNEAIVLDNLKLRFAHAHEAETEMWARAPRA